MYWPVGVAEDAEDVGFVELVPEVVDPPPHPTPATTRRIETQSIPIRNFRREEKRNGTKPMAPNNSAGSLNAADVPEVVVTSTETVAEVVVPENVTDAGWTEQVELAGAPEHENCTDPENPIPGDTVRGTLPEAPRLSVNEDCVPLLCTVKGTRPIPVSATECGLPGALSVMVRMADRFPAVLGENFSCTLHAALGTTVAH